MARTPTRLGLSRDQLASFLNDFEQIKQFENLFASVDEMSNVTIDETNIAADNALSSANQALAEISSIAQETALLSLAPPDLGGTVTRVGLSAGTTGLTVAGTNPITTSGTFTLGGTLNLANGGTGATTASGARTNLGATTVGGNFFTLTNPSAITFPQINADNTVSALDAATFRTAIGAGTGTGTVTAVTGIAPVVSSGGTTPAISMAAATTSVNGYLTSTDWNTFNGKQAALVSGTNIKTVNGSSLLGSGPLGTITAGFGGTGQSTYAVGDILYASAATTLSKLAGVAIGNALISGGVTTAPSYGKIGLTTHISGTLAIGNGGTGATTAPAALTALGAAASGANTDITALDQDVTVTATGTIAADTIGFRGLPQNAQTSAYTLVLADQGKHIFATAAAFTITIPTNGTAAFPVGTEITLFVGDAAKTLAPAATVTLILGGTALTGNRTLAINSVAKLLKLQTNVWVVWGAGVT